MQTVTPALRSHSQTSGLRFTIGLALYVFFLCVTSSLGFAEVYRAPDFGAGDRCNVPGIYSSGQEVCDARAYRLNLSFPLYFLSDSPNSGTCLDSFGRFAGIWAWPAIGYYCPPPSFQKMLAILSGQSVVG